MCHGTVSNTLAKSRYTESTAYQNRYIIKCQHVYLSILVRVLYVESTRLVKDHRDPWLKDLSVSQSLSGVNLVITQTYIIKWVRHSANTAEYRVYTTLFVIHHQKTKVLNRGATIKKSKLTLMCYLSADGTTDDNGSRSSKLICWYRGRLG